MSTCSTSRGVARALALGAGLVCAGPAGGEELEWRGEATAGLRLYHFSSPFDDDDQVSFFDQYRHVRDKDKSVPYFLDLFHLDVGLARGDDTTLLRFERWSPSASNDRALLDLDWEGLSFEGGYHRFRTESLRVFPTGTGLGAALGSVYNDDTAAGDSFFVRRWGLDGALRLRPEDFGLESDLREVSLFGGYEHRSGKRQDRFLLNDAPMADALILDATARFRGRTRDLDQDIVTIGAGLVSTPWQALTSAFDFQFQSFREDADQVLLSDVAAADPARIVPIGDNGLRGFNLVPNTNRYTGQLQLSRRVGEATLNAGAFGTYLEQVGQRAPLQSRNGLDDNYLVTWSAHAAADVPLGESFRLDAFAKVVSRDNHLDRSTALFRSDNGTQVDPFLDERTEWTGGGELIATLAPGAVVAAGYRFDHVDRGLRYASPTTAAGIPNEVILPRVSVVHGDSEVHAVYARSHARLARGLRVSGEVGYEWAPQVGLPRELGSAVYLRGRGSYLLPRPVPLTLSLSGRYLDGDNKGDEIEFIGVDGTGAVDPATTKDKQFERRLWDYALTVSAVPRESVVLFASFAQQRDRQRFAHVRSNLPRYFEPFADGVVAFFLDSKPTYESDMLSLLAGASFALNERVDLALQGGVTWVRAEFPSGGTTASVLESVNEIDSTISSLSATLGYRVSPALRVEVGFLTNAYHDRERIEFNYSTREYTGTLSVTVDFSVLEF